MERFLSDKLWTTVAKLARGAVKRAAVAYISSDEFVKFGAGDTLVCDASPASIASGQTSAVVLARAIKRGAEVYSAPGLHAKVMLLDGRAVIGSANVSSSSTQLIEAAWMTDEARAVTMAQSFIRQLAVPSARIAAAEIQQLLSIPVVRRSVAVRRRRKFVFKSPDLRTWVIGVRELVKDPPEQGPAGAHAKILSDRMAKPRSSIQWVRWTGKSQFRKEARADHRIVQIWRPANRKFPESVFLPMPLVDRREIGEATYFFYQHFSNADETAISWREFLRLARRAGITRKIAPASQFEINENQAEALRELWKG